MIGSLGTVVIFWLCGALERKTVTEKVSPELKDATVQAEYTQATSDETSDFRQMLSSPSPLPLLSRLGQCKERINNL